MTHLDVPKPPPIVVGVNGIESKAVVNTNNEPSMDWRRVMGLPPFQMFIASIIAFEPDQYESVVSALLEQCSQTTGALQTLFDDYCAWHQQKGQWPKEDPLGNLLEK